jgi:sugar O-acyltransferase (sialic acid O-acetyltransferase NeuD family)
MLPLYILGAGAQGRVVREAAARLWPQRAVFFLDDAHALHGHQVMDTPVVGALAQLPSTDACVVHVALGDNTLRLKVCQQVLAQGYMLETIVHPAATVAPDVHLGSGACVLAGAVVQTGAKLGMACLVNSAAVVEHDAMLANGVHVAGRAYVGPAAHLDTCAWVGASATVLGGLHMGAHAQLGAAALLTKAQPAYSVWLGVPAKPKPAK